MTSFLTLKKRSQYLSVYGRGKSWAGPLVVVKALPNELEFSRYGFSVTKALGNAVTRNRVKRLLKEIVRLAPVEPGWDIVFIARSAIVTADYRQVKMSVEKLLTRSNLLRDKHEAASTGAN